MNDSLIQKLKHKLSLPLPGREAQFRMAPSLRAADSKTRILSKAGVLLFLYPNGNDWCIAFIKRQEYPGVHSGQISFPGGKTDSLDLNTAHTALRETEEEIGVSAKQINMLGQLTKLCIPVSGFEVYPFVGFTYAKPAFKIDAHEVQYLIEAKLTDLLIPSARQERPYSDQELMGTIPYFSVQGHQIWGATAMILNEFLTLIGD
jgi:8-oxo-dGTP pyrophosphatase MutT (NUDIX family)